MKETGGVRIGAAPAAGKKFGLRCVLCGGEIGGFARWFGADQRCPDCGSDQAEVIYRSAPKRIQPLFDESFPALTGMWRYFDVLPIEDRRNIVTAGEGLVPIDRWEFLEEYARKRFHIRCRVRAHRQDDNYATGTFKDLSGSLVASGSEVVEISRRQSCYGMGYWDECTPRSNARRGGRSTHRGARAILEVSSRRSSLWVY